MSNPDGSSSGAQPSSHSHALSLSHTGSAPSSPIASLLRFFRPNGPPGSPAHTSLSQSSPAMTPPVRSLSDPTAGSPGADAVWSSHPALSTSSHRPHALSLSTGGGPGLPSLTRARSLESDPFQLGDSAVPASAGGAGSSPNLVGPSSYPSSPNNPLFRTFSVQSGYPAAEAQRKKSNGFLELLARQDSFMSND